MSERLQEMLAKARAAEAEAEAARKAESARAEQTAAEAEQARVSGVLEQHAALTEQLARAQAEHKEALRIKEEAEKLAEGKEQRTEALQQLLDDATKTVEERTNDLEALKQNIRELESDPAVAEVLAEQARNEARRIELQNEYMKITYMKGGNGHEGSMYSIFEQNMDYRDRVAGTHGGNSALVKLSSYAMRTTGMLSDGPKTPLPEAEAAVARITILREEAEKPTPDVARIDQELSTFMTERLTAYADTYPERVTAAAEHLRHHYEQDPQGAERFQVAGRTTEEWAKHIADGLPTPDAIRGEIARITQQEGYHAKELAKFCESLERKSFVLGSGANATDPWERRS